VLRRAAHLDGSALYHDSAKPVTIKNARQRRLLSRVSYGAMLLEDVDSILHRDAGRTGNLARLRSIYAGSQNLLVIAPLELRRCYDVILVEQGYGGVYVHSYELAKSLRRNGYSVLLLSPEDPLFEKRRHPDDVTLPRLRELCANVDYFSYYNLLRGLVGKLETSLLLIAHRSQSLLLFDLIADRKTVIYCDGFLDGGFSVARETRMKMTGKMRARIVTELNFLAATSGRGFYSIYGGPGMNRFMLAAGYHALTSARQNWFWGQRQYENFISAMPEHGSSSRLVLPFTRPSMFRRAKECRVRKALFTTTMHNIDKKGFPELVSLMQKLPSLRVRCVVRQPQRLPSYPAAISSRLEIGTLNKDEMVRLYHRVWCNIRTSREESSPLSILESMTCSVPQVVSPCVAEQIPIIEDGATGYVVDPDDIDRLQQCVSKLMRDREMRDAMGEEARRRASMLSLRYRASVFEGLLHAKGCEP
jgi:glycosyltransferase involved in cell wall biosynthesis